MSEHPHGTSREDTAEGGVDDRETAADELQEAQRGRGYGEDEGERDDALDENGEQ